MPGQTSRLSLYRETILKPFIATLVVICLLAVSSSATSQTRVKHFEPAVVVAGESKQGVTPVQIALAGGVLEASLAPNQSLLGKMPRDFRERLAQRGMRLFEGRIDGIANSWVRLSRQGAQWQGAWFDGDTLFLLDPATSAKQLGKLPATAKHVAYRVEDLVIDGLDHDIAGRPGGYLDWTRELAEEFSVAKGGLKELELTVVTDTEFTTVHGAGNRDAIVAGRLNVVDGIYRDQLSVQVSLKNLRHLTDNGPLTMTLPTGGNATNPDLISTFRSYMSGGAGNSIPKADLNHLFSGKDFDGSTAGVAYVGVLCSSSFGYAINQVRSSSASTAVIIAHEMGHNFGANHDGGSSACESGRWIMSPSVSGALNQFSTCSLDVMVPRVNNAACLSTIVVPPTAFYVDGFEG